MTSKELGPLAGVRVLEFAGIGPAPFCAMLLADLGADIVRIDRPTDIGKTEDPVIGRGRRSIVLDLKSHNDRTVALELVRQSKILLEGYRPGVMERLGLGPHECHQVHPGIVYVRLTGWGQQAGPLTHKAGHDINYIAAAGVLGAIGGEQPTIPLNLLGDYAGGSLFACVGLLAALRAADHGQQEIVIDASMRSGATYLLSYQYEMLAKREWVDARHSNLLDGGAPFYNTFVCSDGKWIAVGAIEDKFFLDLLTGLGLTTELGEMDRHARANQDHIQTCLAKRFASQPRDVWLARFANLDACVSPIQTMSELIGTPALRERVRGIPEPIPAPAFNKPLGVPRAAPRVGQHTREILEELRSHPRDQGAGRNNHDGR